MSIELLSSRLAEARDLAIALVRRDLMGIEAVDAVDEQSPDAARDGASGVVLATPTT